MVKETISPRVSEQWKQSNHGISNTRSGHPGCEDKQYGDPQKHCHPDHCGHCHQDAHIADINPNEVGKISETRSIYRILNMDCPMEEALIRKKLDGNPGIRKLHFNLLQRTLTVDHDPGVTEAIEDALREIDMNPEPIKPSSKIEPVPETKIPWRKLIVSGIIALFSEIFELLGEWQPDIFGNSFANYSVFGFSLFESVAFILAIIAILVSGLGTFKKGWLAIANLNLNINALMAVAVSGALLIGQFPEAAMVMVLFNISEAIESRALDRARNAIKDLLSLVPETATLISDDGRAQVCDIHEIQPGTIIRVRPGEKIALDGEIVDGASSVNQAPITGESMPVEKKPGDTVYAGTINGEGSFKFRVTALADDTTLAKIIHAVEDAQGSRAPIQRYVDIFAKYYTPAVFILAVAMVFVPHFFFGQSWQEAIYTALVILVIGCPCALVISTPVTVVSGLAAATRNGILIKGGLYLEQGRRLKWLALDKTGTLTEGRPQLVDYIPIRPDVNSKIIAASLASRSDHPVSRAIAQAYADADPLEVDDFRAIPGHGVSGRVDGKKWLLVNRSFFKKMDNVFPETDREMQEQEKQGKTVVALVGDNGIAALFAAADTLRPAAAKAIDELRHLAVRPIMLTGDNDCVARAIARNAGLDEFRANLLPDQKLEEIDKLSSQGAVVGMVGDGINDAPALAKADIGFAMAAGGTDTAIETADVAIMDDDLRKIPRFIQISRRTHIILVENIIIALGIKALFFALTLTGNATMWMAVFADVGAALLVVANGLRARKV